MSAEAVADPAQNPTNAKRNVAVLVAAQAILGAQMPIHFTLGGLSGQMLAADPCWATLPISLTVIGSMCAAPFMSGIMQKHGRRPGFFLGAAAGAAGAAICAYALFAGSFFLFLLGSFVMGIYMSSQGFLRFAAADTASPAFRPKAISYVMAGGLLAAFFGPQLLKITRDTMAVPFAGAYVTIIALNVFGSLIFFALSIPRPKPKSANTSGRSRLELLRDHRILTAMVCAMVAYALMTLVMTATPLAVVGCGFEVDDAANIVSAHVIAMFAPSFFTGHLIARFGVERIIGTGLVILFGAAL